MRSWNTYIESWDVRQWINVAILGWMQTNVCTWSGLRATQLMYKFWGSNSEPPKNQLRTPTWGCKYWISPLKLWLYNPLISGTAPRVRMSHAFGSGIRYDMCTNKENLADHMPRFPLVFWKQVGCAPAQSGTSDGWEQVRLERGEEKN